MAKLEPHEEAGHWIGTAWSEPWSEADEAEKCKPTDSAKSERGRLPLVLGNYIHFFWDVELCKLMTSWIKCLVSFQREREHIPPSLFM